MVNRPNPGPSEADITDEIASKKEDEPIYAADNSRPPAASLTSIRLGRRRPVAGRPGLEVPSKPVPPPQIGMAAGLPMADAVGGDPPRGTPVGRGDAPQSSAVADAAPQPLAPAAGPGPARPSNIVDYWSRLRAGRNFPSPSDLDADLIVASWPNSILLSCTPGRTDMRAAALFKPLGGQPQDTFLDDFLEGVSLCDDFAPMVVEWVLSLAEDTVRRARPLAEKEVFVLPEGPVHYGACTLPLSEDQINVDHVLCYLCVLR